MSLWTMYTVFHLHHFQPVTQIKLQVGWSVEGLQRMERHGRLHLPTLFNIQLEQYKAAGADCLQQVCPTTPPRSAPTLGKWVLSSPGAELPVTKGYRAYASKICEISGTLYLERKYLM